MAIEGDVVLIYQNKQPTVFARVEDIQPDVKKQWYHITLLLLTIPTQTVTWILKDLYIEGQEFTMGGIPMKLEAVPKTPLQTADTAPLEKTPRKNTRKQGTVIPFKKP